LATTRSLQSSGFEHPAQFTKESVRHGAIVPRVGFLNT
jgi:hypothetical protein